MTPADAHTERARRLMVRQVRRWWLGDFGNGVVAKAEAEAVALREISDEFAAVEREAREACAGIVEYSVANDRDRAKTLARIREGHEQHVNAEAKEVMPHAPEIIPADADLFPTNRAESGHASNTRAEKIAAVFLEAAIQDASNTREPQLIDQITPEMAAKWNPRVEVSRGHDRDRDDYAGLGAAEAAMAAAVSAHDEIEAKLEAAEARIEKLARALRTALLGCPFCGGRGEMWPLATSPAGPCKNVWCEEGRRALLESADKPDDARGGDSK